MGSGGLIERYDGGGVDDRGDAVTPADRPRGEKVGGGVTERRWWAWVGEGVSMLRFTGAAGIISAFASHHSALIHVRVVDGDDPCAKPSILLRPEVGFSFFEATPHTTQMKQASSLQ